MMKMGIGRLRREHPSWTWSVTRRGFAGRAYEGRKGDRRVEVIAYGVLCGPTEDDTCTQWRVIENRESTPYALFEVEEVEEISYGN